MSMQNPAKTGEWCFIPAKEPGMAVCGTSRVFVVAKNRTDLGVR